MGRKAKEISTEQLTAEVPVGGRERYNALADRLTGGNRSRLLIELLDAAEAAQQAGADLETILSAMRGGKSVAEQVKQEIRVGRAAIRAMGKASL